MEVDDAAHPIALPSFARSIGYLTELVLPLLLPVKPPPRDEIDVTWDGGHHRVLFRPLDGGGCDCSGVGRGAAAGGGAPGCFSAHSPQRGWAKPALWNRRAMRTRGSARQASSAWNADRLGRGARRAERRRGHAHRRHRGAERLAFLRFHRVEHEGHPIELVTPSTGVSVAILPYVMARDGAHFVLWNELRVAALERRARQPLFDLPVPVRYANATGAFVLERELRLLASDPRALAEDPSCPARSARA